MACCKSPCPKTAMACMISALESISAVPGCHSHGAPVQRVSRTLRIIGRSVSCRADDFSRASLGRGSAEHHEIKQGVRAQAVCPVH